jgi:hypothetical protein
MRSPCLWQLFTLPWFYALNYYKLRAIAKSGDFALKTQLFQRKYFKKLQNETKKMKLLHRQ